MQRYLVTFHNPFPDFLSGLENKPFLTDYFDPENTFSWATKMVVYDLANGTYTTDGTTWHPLTEDHL